MDTNVKLEAAWWQIYKELKIFIGDDPEVEISDMDESAEPAYRFTISSQNEAKITALSRVLINHYDMGNITLDIDFEHIRNDEDATREITKYDIEAAFQGNPHYVSTQVTTKGMFADLCYVIFAKEIIQFFNDDLSDLYGNENIIVADLARERCNLGQNMYFCTANGSESNE